MLIVSSGKGLQLTQFSARGPHVSVLSIIDILVVALIIFGFRIFNNVALIRRHFIRG